MTSRTWEILNDLKLRRYDRISPGDIEYLEQELERLDRLVRLEALPEPRAFDIRGCCPTRVDRPHWLDCARPLSTEE